MASRVNVATISLSAAALAISATALANVPLHTGLGGPRDYGTDCLSPNDDGSSAAIDITPAFPSGLHFFSDTHTQAFVNTNGNITFSGAEPVFTPQAFPVAQRPMIAAYWADVDVRALDDGDCRGLGQATSEVGSAGCESPDHNGAWWRLEPGKMTITWDVVGYYSCRLNHAMDFQMILTAVDTSGACGATPGDFDVEFRFNRCEWTTGDASGGTDGFGGTPAQVGFDAGNLVDFVQIAGSMTGDINNIACNDSNVGEAGRWVFQIRGGNVVCPDSGTACDTGQPGICALGRTSCVGAGTQCQVQVTPGTEVCNALDDNCDGEVDNGAVCLEGGLCQNGVCVVCGESGCLIDEACTDVTCDAGLRCIDGACVDACSGVSCPVGTQCRAGSCIDACAGFACDACSVCTDGVCAALCTAGSCAAGNSCGADGRCVPEACATLTCDPGFYCDAAGACADACAGAVCPSGQHCDEGACVAGADPAPGEGEGEGDGGEGDGGEGDAGEGEGEGDTTNCGCAASRASDTPASDTPATALACVLGTSMLWVGRRRRVG